MNPGRRNLAEDRRNIRLPIICLAARPRMRYIATFIFILSLFALIESSIASDVGLYVDSCQVTNTICVISCVISNASDQEVFIAPICVLEVLYGPHNDSGSATNWSQVSAFGIADEHRVAGTNGYILIASKSSLRFDLNNQLMTGGYAGNYIDHNPWRVSAFGYTLTMDLKHRLLLYTDKQQPKTHL